MVGRPAIRSSNSLSSNNVPTRSAGTCTRSIIKTVRKVVADQFVEAFQEGLQLILNTRRHLMLADLLNILLSVLQSYRDVAAIGYLRTTTTDEQVGRRVNSPIQQH